MQTASRQEGNAVERRQYEIRTFGCQMNVHDSERIAGVLEADGYTSFDGEGTPAVSYTHLTLPTTPYV